MDSHVIAAAILASAYAQAQREPLTLGILDTSIREKFVEYLAFVKANTPPPTAAKEPRARSKAKSAIV